MPRHKLFELFSMDCTQALRRRSFEKDDNLPVYRNDVDFWSFANAGPKHSKHKPLQCTQIFQQQDRARVTI